MCGKEGREAKEIDITPEMAEAGTDALCAFFSWSLSDPEKIVRAVFEAMIAASQEATEGPFE